MLLRGEGIDLTAPVCEFAASHFLIDFERNVIDHASRFPGYTVYILDYMLRTESLDCK